MLERMFDESILKAWCHEIESVVLATVSYGIAIAAEAVISGTKAFRGGMKDFTPSESLNKWL